MLPIRARFSVRKPINANPGLGFNQSKFPSCSLKIICKWNSTLKVKFNSSQNLRVKIFWKCFYWRVTKLHFHPALDALWVNNSAISSLTSVQRVDSTVLCRVYFPGLTYRFTQNVVLLELCFVVGALRAHFAPAHAFCKITRREKETRNICRQITLLVLVKAVW